MFDQPVPSPPLLIWAGAQERVVEKKITTCNLVNNLSSVGDTGCLTLDSDKDKTLEHCSKSYLNQ